MVSLDVLRGTVMFLMLAEAMHFHAGALVRGRHRMLGRAVKSR
jgi:hypothetical protein